MNVDDNQRRRLLLLVHHIGPGGMEQQLLHLARGLADRGCEVTVGCLNPIDHHGIAEAERRGVRVLRLGARSRRARVTSVAAQVRALARQSDLVHCTGWDASLWGRLGAIAARRPVVVTEHALDRERQLSSSGAPRARAIGWHHRLLSPWTHTVIAVAESQVELLRREGVPVRKIAVVPNGVPLDGVRAAAGRGPSRADLGVPEGARVVVQVARFHPVKRQDLTYDAVRELRGQLGDVHVLFVGYATELQERLAERVAADGAGDWVHFLGVRSDVAGILALADLAVLPSEAEALPMAVIEAMALGVPQVVTDIGDMGAVVRAARAGIVVERGDTAAFRDACGRLLSDGSLAGEAGGRAAAAATQFDAAIMIDRYVGIFERAIAGAPPAGFAGRGPEEVLPQAPRRG